MKKSFKIILNFLLIIASLGFIAVESRVLAEAAFAQYSVEASAIIFAIAVAVVLSSLKSKGYAFADVNAGIGLARNRIISTFDMLKPEVRTQLMPIYGDQGLSYFNLLESLGYSRGISRNSALTYEQDWIHQLINVGIGGMTGDASYASNGMFSFPLSSAAGTNTYLPYATAAPYTNSASPNLYSVPIQINDRIRFEENGAIAHVYNITGAGTSNVTLWCKLADVTKNITLANYPAGTPLAVVTNAWSDGSKQPRGLTHNVRKSYAYTQIIKGGFSWDGATETDQIWFDTIYNGKDIVGYHVLGQEYAEYELLAKIDQALMWERPNANNIMDPLTDEPNRSTEGLVPYIERTGNKMQVGAGTFSTSIFDTVSSILEKQFAPNNLLWMTGYAIDVEINNAMKDYFQMTGVDYTKKITTDVFMGDEGLAASVNFRGFQKGRFMHNFVQMPMFSHPQFVPAGYKTSNMALVVPMAKTKNPKLGTELPYIGSVYKSKNGYSRKMEVWTLSGAGPREKVLEDDLSLLCYRSEVGAEHTGGNRMIKIYA